MAEELSAAGVVAEPKGLSLSLDQLIREKQDHNPGDGRAAPRQQEYEQRRGGHQGRGRGGRGGRGIDRGHFNSGYGPQQGRQVTHTPCKERKMDVLSSHPPLLSRAQRH